MTKLECALVVVVVVVMVMVMVSTLITIMNVISKY